MNKQNQIKIYLISIFFSFFYLILFTTNIFAEVQINKHPEPGFFVFTTEDHDSLEASSNEFPRTVGTVSRENYSKGFTVLEWEDKNIFGFLDPIGEIFTYSFWFGSENNSKKDDNSNTRVKANIKTDIKANKKAKSNNLSAGSNNKIAQNIKPTVSALGHKTKDSASIEHNRHNNSAGIEIVELDSSNSAEVVDRSRVYSRED